MPSFPDHASHRQKARWGTGDIGVSDVNTGLLAENPRCGAWHPLVRAPPQCVSQRRESNPLFQGTKYPVSSPPASVEPRALARMRQTNNCSAAAPAAPHSCGLRRVRSAIGVRLIASFPPAGPARLGTRVSARAPGSGSPVPAVRRQTKFSERALPSGNKKPSGASGSGGLASAANCRSLSQARSLPWARHALSIGVKPFDSWT